MTWCRKSDASGNIRWRKEKSNKFLSNSIHFPCFRLLGEIRIGRVESWGTIQQAGNQGHSLKFMKMPRRIGDRLRRRSYKKRRFQNGFYRDRAVFTVL